MSENVKLNLYQKLLKIQEKVMGLKKDADGDKYKFVSGSKVLDHIKPIMNEYGILLKQEIISIDNTRQDYTTKNGAKSEILARVMMKFTWVDCETGDKDENLFGANGQNGWDKGVGSALTYGERYFLLKYFHIETDEDDIDAKKKAEFTQAIFDKFKVDFKKYKDKYTTPDAFLSMLDVNYILTYKMTKEVVKFYKSIES